MEEGFEHYVKESLSLLKDGSLIEGFEVFDSILRRDPTSIGMWKVKGDVLWELDHYDFALMCHLVAEHLKRLDEYPSSLLDKFSNTSKEISHQVLLGLENNRGKVDKLKITDDRELDVKRYQDFITMMEEKLEDDPFSVDGLYQVALATFYLKYYGQTVDFLDRLLEQEPGHENAILHRYLALMEAGDYVGALPDVVSLVRGKPEDAQYWHLLGDAYIRLRQNEDAIDAYDRSFYLDNTMISSLFKKGVVLGRSGQLDEAFRIYSKLAVYKSSGSIEVEPNYHPDGLVDDEEPTPVPEEVPKKPRPPAVQRLEDRIKQKEKEAKPEIKEAIPVKEPEVKAEPEVVEEEIEEKEEEDPIESDDSSDLSGRDPQGKPKPKKREPSQIRGVPFTADDEYYIRTLIDGSLEQGGGGAYLYVNPMKLFEFSLLMLTELTSEFNMNGVVITVEKPAQIYLRMLDGPLYNKVNHVPYFVDCVTKLSSIHNEDPNIIPLKKYFDMEELEEAVELGLHKASEDYSGQRFFILCDNVAAFQYYTSPKNVRKFFNNYGKKLEKLHLYGYFLVGDGQMNIQLSDMIKNLPMSLIKKVSKR